MSDIEEIKRFLNALYKRDNINVNHKNHIVKILDKLTKEIDRWENELNLQIGWLDVERKKNAKLLNANILLANERLKLKEEIEGLEKEMFLKDVKHLTTQNLWSNTLEENTKLKEGLNDIKSQLFDVNRCDTILTSAIEQILKNK